MMMMMYTSNSRQFSGLCTLTQLTLCTLSMLHCPVDASCISVTTSLCWAGVGAESVMVRPSLYCIPSLDTCKIKSRVWGLGSWV